MATPRKRGNRRTQMSVGFDDAQHAWLASMAERYGTFMAEIVRRVVDAEMDRQQAPRSKSHYGEVIHKAVPMVEVAYGKPDGSAGGIPGTGKG